MGYLAVILGAYLLGSSSMAYYLAKLTKKDVSKKRQRKSGSLQYSDPDRLEGRCFGRDP